MYLYLNTTDHDFIHLALVKYTGQILVMKKISAFHQQSEKLLFNIQKILTSAKYSLNKLKGIIVVSGPGGFTSLRIGLSVANTLAWSLQLPIVGVRLRKFALSEPRATRGESKGPLISSEAKIVKEGLIKIKNLKKFRPIMPKYGSAPHITLKKK